MKKLMILAAVVMAVVAANAAAVGWTIAGGTNYKGGGYDVFIIGMNGVESASQIAGILATSGDVTSLDSYAFYKGGTVNNSGAATLAATASGVSITYKEGGSAAENTYQAFAILWDAEVENATYTSVVSTTLANNSTSKTFTFGNQASNFAANSFSVAPEPTSGLLLLLGVAGLALRRKRA